MTAKPAVVIGAVLLVFSYGYALAASPCAVGQRMSSSQITALVASKYTCVGTFPSATWNELLSGGTVTDYKQGPADPRDPTTLIGAYAVGGQNNNNSGGILTYTYSNGGGTYPWYIDLTHAGNVYTFCPTGGGGNISVNVQATHC